MAQAEWQPKNVVGFKASWGKFISCPIVGRKSG